MQSAAVRTRHMAVFLACIDALPSKERELVRREIPPADVELVHGPAAREWMDAAVNVRWVKAVSRGLDGQGFDRFFRTMLRRDFEDSFFKGFVAGVLRLFGGNVGVLVRRIPTGFALMWRDYGQVEAVSALELESRLCFEQMAPVLMDETWFSSVRASLAGLFDVLEVDGQSQLVEYDAGARRAVISLRWSQRATTKEPSIR